MDTLGEYKLGHYSPPIIPVSLTDSVSSAGAELFWFVSFWCLVSVLPVNITVTLEN